MILLSIWKWGDNILSFIHLFIPITHSFIHSYYSFIPCLLSFHQPLPPSHPLYLSFYLLRLLKTLKNTDFSSKKIQIPGNRMALCRLHQHQSTWLCYFSILKYHLYGLVFTVFKINWELLRENWEELKLGKKKKMMCNRNILSSSLPSFSTYTFSFPYLFFLDTSLEMLSMFSLWYNLFVLLLLKTKFIYIMIVLNSTTCFLSFPSILSLHSFLSLLSLVSSIYLHSLSCSHLLTYLITSFTSIWLTLVLYSYCKLSLCFLECHIFEILHKSPSIWKRSINSILHQW